MDSELELQKLWDAVRRLSGDIIYVPPGQYAPQKGCKISTAEFEPKRQSFTIRKNPKPQQRKRKRR